MPKLVELMIIVWSFSGNAEMFHELANQKFDSQPQQSIVAIRDVPKPAKDLKKFAELLKQEQKWIENSDAGKPADESPIDFASLPDTGPISAEFVIGTIAAHLGGHKKLAARLAEHAKERMLNFPGDLEHELHIQRELLHLLSIYYHDIGDQPSELSLLEQRLRVTTTNFTTQPNLVGAAVVQYTDCLDRDKDVADRSPKNYQSVILDLGYLTKDFESYPPAEAAAAVYWLGTACDRHFEITGDEDSSKGSETVANLLTKIKFNDDFHTSPRIGMISKLYVGEVRVNALIMHKGMELALANAGDRSKLTEPNTMRYLNHYFGCTTDDVKFFAEVINLAPSQAILDEMGVNAKQKRIFGRVDATANAALRHLKSLKLFEL
jgi:hypothetical protein